MSIDFSTQTDIRSINALFYHSLYEGANENGTKSDFKPLSAPAIVLYLVFSYSVAGALRYKQYTAQ